VYLLQVYVARDQTDGMVLDWKLDQRDRTVRDSILGPTFDPGLVKASKEPKILTKVPVMQLI